jgi:hypothetical protein
MELLAVIVGLEKLKSKQKYLLFLIQVCGWFNIEKMGFGWEKNGFRSKKCWFMEALVSDLL